VYLSGQICFSALNAKTEFKLADMICVVFSYIDFNFHNGELELHLCTTCVRERAAADRASLHNLGCMNPWNTAKYHAISNININHKLLAQLTTSQRLVPS
jgi:hypothetical protein